jgi:hypothetical protein
MHLYYLKVTEKKSFASGMMIQMILTATVSLYWMKEDLKTFLINRKSVRKAPFFSHLFQAIIGLRIFMISQNHRLDIRKMSKWNLAHIKTRKYWHVWFPKKIAIKITDHLLCDFNYAFLDFKFELIIFYTVKLDEITSKSHPAVSNWITLYLRNAIVSRPNEYQVHRETNKI